MKTLLSGKEHLTKVYHSYKSKYLYSNRTDSDKQGFAQKVLNRRYKIYI